MIRIQKSISCKKSKFLEIYNILEICDNFCPRQLVKENKN